MTHDPLLQSALTVQIMFQIHPSSHLEAKQSNFRSAPEVTKTRQALRWIHSQITAFSYLKELPPLLKYCPRDIRPTLNDRPQRGCFSLLPPLRRQHVTETGMTSREVAILHSLANFSPLQTSVFDKWEETALSRIIFYKYPLSASTEPSYFALLILNLVMKAEAGMISEANTFFRSCQAL